PAPSPSPSAVAVAVAVAVTVAVAAAMALGGSALGITSTVPSHLSPHFCLWGGSCPEAPQPHPSQPCGQRQGVSQGPQADTSLLCPLQWDLVCASRWKVPLEQTTHLLGWTLGSPLSQPVPGRFGRRPTFLLSLALAVPVGLGVALAVDFLMVLVARLLFGAALAGAFLALYVARECDGGGHRGAGTGGAPGCTGSRMLQAVGCPRI
uniref:Uncharacterized protein n=1 Tax=Corvus moneduloides TaxID=1196302 RepID=A0A8U7MP10_CORMO